MFTIGMDGNTPKIFIIILVMLINCELKEIIFKFKSFILKINPLKIPISDNLSVISDNQILTTDKNIKVFNDKEIKEIIFGCLLGDGSLEKSVKSKNARFKFSQSLKAKEYFLHLFLLFKPYFTENYNYANYNHLDKRTNKTYSTLSFSTKALPLFTEFYDQFYLNNNKIIPNQEYFNLLTPLALAH